MAEHNKKADDIIRKYEMLKGERGVWEAHWQEISQLVLPRRGDFNTKSVPGSKNMLKVFDATPIWANEQLAGALNGMLTNPETKWFLFKTKDRSFMKFKQVKIWLEKVENRIREVFATPEANFNSQSHELYLDLGAYGTAGMFVEETPGEGPGIRYKTLSLSDILYAEGKSGMIDTMYRVINMRLRVAFQLWGKAIGEKLIKILEQKPYSFYTFYHTIRPRADQDFSKDTQISTNKAFESTYVDPKNRETVHESGFDVFPILVPRWFKIIGETYGRSPAMTALPDIKMLNRMAKAIIRSAEKKVEPPLQMPDDGFMGPIRTGPNALNFYRLGLSQHDRISPVDFGGDIGLGVDMMDRVTQKILSTFYLDRLSLQKEKVEMTRREAEIRKMENIQQMSPVLGRLEMEFLDPVIEMTFDNQQRQFLLPPPPPILVENEAELEIEYISPMIRAQRSGEAVAIQQGMELIAPIAQAKPDVIDNFNADEIAQGLPDWFGTPQKTLNSPAEVAKIRSARARQEQIREAQDTAVVQSQTLKNTKEALAKT